MKYLDALPRYIFFTGKGGVGKTSVACATAVDLIDQGRRVLLVSTDPASNVGHVFGQRIGNQIMPIVAAPGLDALEIEPEQAAADYRERTLAPVRGFLSAVDLASVTEQLSGACTTEIASFNEFTGLLADTDQTLAYDHIIFDTAPTGHTIRLLQLPGEWTRFIDDGKGDTSCLGPMAGLEKSRTTYGRALAALADPARTRLVLVARAQPGALTEAARTVDELVDAGVSATHLVVNAILPTDPDHDPLADAICDRETAALAALPPQLADLTIDLLPLRGTDMVGVPALRGLLREESAAVPLPPADDWSAADPVLPGLDSLVGALAEQDHGLVMCMGKGGVGKTTVATAIARRLVARGKDVHLTTTDPAAHLDLSLAHEGMRVSSINPEQAVADYRSHVMATKGATLDDDGRAQLAEDLRSPCTEEIAVFQAFSQAVLDARRRFVIMDTAPTGHTLLLLDATGSYHHDVARNMTPGTRFTTPMMRLQDPGYTKVIIVTLAETTPVLEAEQLQADLERAGIHPWAWVVNQTLTGNPTTDPLLRRRQAAERGPLDRVGRARARSVQVPLTAGDPATSGAAIHSAIA
ncbi:arsenical pump-driving ATPase [Raineyella sp. W15-4]|uniref:arsenical pump-driving ATPase n=1 Tax=Raineyella sp. W15-4 TaxID=3081651 RepID=UPI002954747C|nr:arsenical pump-driving ATPase [Raineyella sp. W15-4]WOQ16901.1 arsenical pump-driving ATPase [Raineyella sp. W15-4]